MIFPLKFYLKIVTNTFLHTHNLHQQYFLCLISYKNLLFQVIKFHWIFLNHPCIHNHKINLLISWLENFYVLKNSFHQTFFNNSEKYEFVFYYIIIFKVYVFNKALAIFVFDSAIVIFFIIAYLFIFNFLNSFSKNIDKIW